MTHRVVVAVVAGWLPEWEPPLSDQGFDRAYRDRIKVELQVDDLETLRSVYDRAIAAIAPRARPMVGGHAREAIETVYWVWFYEPADAENLDHKHYQQARALVTIDQNRRARWHRGQDEIPYGDVVRAAEYGLLRGDPLRPYVVLQLPQGGGEYQVGFEVLLRAWEVLEGVLATREAVGLVRGLRGRLAGTEVLKSKRQEFEQRRADAFDLMDLARSAPWGVEDLRTVMGLETETDAVKVLRLAGCSENEEGRFEFSSDDEEAAFLQMAERDVFRRALAHEDLDELTLRTIFEAMLRPDEPSRTA